MGILLQVIWDSPVKTIRGVSRTRTREEAREGCGSNLIHRELQSRNDMAKGFLFKAEGKVPQYMSSFSYKPHLGVLGCNLLGISWQGSCHQQAILERRYSCELLAAYIHNTWRMGALTYPKNCFRFPPWSGTNDSSSFICLSKLSTNGWKHSE